MNQSDIEHIVKTLNKAIKTEDWILVEEILEYMTEFQDDPEIEEE